MSVFAEFAVSEFALAPGPLLADHPGVTVEIEPTVPAGSLTHYLWVVGGDRASLVAALRTEPGVASVDTLDELADRTLVRVDLADGAGPFLDAVETAGGRLVAASGSSDGWTVDLRFPDQESLGVFYEACGERGVDVRLRGVEEGGVAGDSGPDGVSAIQRETLLAALRTGYFEVPRRTTVTDLAERLGVSEQAVSERLRRGLAAFLAATIGGGHGDADGGSDESDADGGSDESDADA